MELIASGSVPGLLAAVSVLLALHFLVKVGEFLWHLKEKKDTVTETGIENLSAAVQLNTAASEKLEHRIKNLEHTISDVTKVKLDLRRLYIAVKNIAGDKWPVIRKEIMDEEATT